MDFNTSRGEISYKRCGCTGSVQALPRAEEEQNNSELSLVGIAFSSWSLSTPGSGEIAVNFDLSAVLE